MYRSVLATMLLLVASVAGAREGDPDPRFSTDGQYTISYDSGTSKLDQALRTLVDSQGRYIVVGYVDFGKVGLARLLPDGSPDPSYAGGGVVSYALPGNVTLTDATLGINDSVVLVGYGLNSLDNDPLVCRYDNNGMPIGAFGANGCHFLPVDYTVNGEGDDRAFAVTTFQGDIFLTGSIERNDPGDFDFFVMRLLPSNGQPRTTFGNNGIVTIAFDVATNHAGGDDDRALSILVVDNVLYVGGYADVGGFDGTDFAIAKLSPFDGTLDATFCVDASTCAGSLKYAGRRTFTFPPGSGIYNERIGALAVSSGGAIGIAGESDGSGTSDVLVAFLSPTTGKIMDFGTEGNRTRITLLAETKLGGFVLQQSSKSQVIVAGTTSTFPGSANPKRSLWVAQLTGSLQLDNNFATSGSVTNWVQTFVFPSKNAAQPMDHAGGSLTLDNHARIVLTGSRLWERDTGIGLNDFDFGIARMSGDAIFVDDFDR